MQIEKFGYKEQLKRSLGLWQLTAFGLNYMIPLSPAIFFGFVLIQSGGTVALPFLIGGLAILLTASSYAVMVQHFPLAGSLYNFVRQTVNPTCGFIAGWVLLLDYLLITTVTSMSAAVYMHQLFPELSYGLLLFIFILLTGGINLLGIQLLASTGLVLLILMEVIVFISFAVWGYAIKVHHVGSGVLISSLPLHFSTVPALINATSLAVACYLGFDAITTLAEEAKNPTKDIPKAIFLCVFIGCLTMSLTGYLGVLLVPDWQQQIHHQDWINTALFQVSLLAGGKNFATFYSLAFITSMFIFNIVATAATARLLFGMGRDRMLYKKIFSAINQRWHSPHWNVILIMLISLAVGWTAAIDTIANLVNFGALLGFGILNLSVVWFYVSNKKSGILLKNYTYLRYVVFPLLGFIIVLWVFYGLDHFTHRLGVIWLIIGIAYLIMLKIIRYKRVLS